MNTVTLLYTIKSGTHNSLVQHKNGPTITSKNSPKDLKGVLKTNFTMLQKYIKIIPIEYAVKYITLQLYIITIVKNITIIQIKYAVKYITIQLYNFTLLLL